jgi:hypothetical protein
MIKMMVRCVIPTSFYVIFSNFISLELQNSHQFMDLNKDWIDIIFPNFDTSHTHMAFND